MSRAPGGKIDLRVNLHIRVKDDTPSESGVKLPVASRPIILSRISSLASVAGITRREVPRRGAIVGPAVGIRVGRRVVAPVGVVVATAGRRVVIDRSTARRRPVARSIVVVFPTRRAPLAIAIAVAIAAGTVATRRPATVVVVTRRRV